MIMSFTYVNAKGEKKPRRVAVVHEGSDRLIGFDLKYLDRKTQNLVKKQFGPGHQPTPVPEVRSNDCNYEKLGISKEVFFKSYRTFLKSNIQ